jgi:signal peptidase I
MSTSLMVIFLVVLGVTSLVCNSGAWLWMATKWCSIQNIRYGRALGAVALIGAINVVIHFALQWIPGKAEAREWLALCISLVAATICLRALLRTSLMRALAAGFITLIISSIVAVPVLLAVRAYVMESFAIPTGAMALAVVGKHYNVTCENCGLRLVVSASRRFQRQWHARGLPAEVYNGAIDEAQVCKCPNCAHERTLPPDYPIADGDRILVEKLGRARRWELVVFQFPQDVATKYLSRLVGLPGETVEIIGGDIFINGRREAKPFGAAPEMWLLVNDTSFSPREKDQDQPSWRAASGSSHWERAHNSWTFSGAGTPEEELVFDGPMTDESFYIERSPEDPASLSGVQSVADVRVTCALRRFSGTGKFGVHWRFNGLQAHAAISAGGEVALQSDDESKQARLTERPLSLGEIVFCIRDGVMSVGANGQEAAFIALGPQDADAVRESLSGTVEPCRLSLAADHCELEISRIVVERDVYYRGGDGQGIGCTGRPIDLGAAEHYVLGDHSVAANDSRYWIEVDPRLGRPVQVGTVPGALMIGVARCIYWPPERWRSFR